MFTFIEYELNTETNPTCAISSSSTSKILSGNTNGPIQIEKDTQRKKLLNFLPIKTNSLTVSIAFLFTIFK